MKPVMLLTERLILRRANENDSDDLFHNYHSDSYSSMFLTRKPYTEIDQTKKFLNEWCHLPWDNEFEKFAWVVAVGSTNESIGVILVELENTCVAQIHFGISSNYTNQGFITEAAGEVVRWLMSQKEIKRIWAVCDLSNQGSKRVLEKIGFKNEGILEQKLILPAFNYLKRDCYFYAYERKT